MPHSYVWFIYFIGIYDPHCPHTNDHSYEWFVCMICIYQSYIRLVYMTCVAHTQTIIRIYDSYVWFVYISRIYDWYIWPALPTYKRSFAYTNDQSTNPFILMICILRMYDSYISLVYMTCIAHIQTIIRIYEWSYGVATVSRIYGNIGLLCRILSLL